MKRHNNKKEYSPNAYSQMRKNSNQLYQNHYYLHVYFRTKQTHADYAVRAAKRTGNALRQIYEAIIST